MSTLRPDIHAELLNERGNEYLPGYLGIELLTLAERTLTSRMPVKKLHVAPNDFLHAASIVALADTTCGYAAMAHLPEGAESFTTIELKSNHLGTVREGGSVSCIATAQHLGRTTQVWDAVVSDAASGRTIALFRCTQMILWPKG
ncbi:PaaI family thioesterase [Pseudothauera rhizosphaerae]|uniref:PaaI family thioesterase n=1 Tax=Pseudothauera rhizosphaerae TaxID=2565932 RepID=A0A4S4ANM4_9RHOO|nr:PaaI family thioesterase [Pseudothauera rhizosphaerae]THF61245.1 PaaI family thioesterase [Pseudothauera rhizosphaerae]